MFCKDLNKIINEDSNKITDEDLNEITESDLKWEFDDVQRELLEMPLDKSNRFSEYQHLMILYIRYNINVTNLKLSDNL